MIYTNKIYGKKHHISALSHEIGEWYDDPLIDNIGPCNGITDHLLEVGDPLEGKANSGTFVVNFGGVKWHPQALALCTVRVSPGL